MSARFTPGPWEVRYRFGRLTTVSGRQRFPICDTGTAPLGEANHPREEANARLIAAAPDLLAALKAFNVTEGMIAGGTPTTLLLHVPIAAIEAAAVAVAKAEGRA